ncbi:hypothetical protein ILP92_08540 [Maribius pontilimi]|uniref:DUF4177 domain-containing protein n=1 Tax=Palleronia pontilimi TaxID=1964209 RepID=A0A934IH78_9RHOB|nr:hypothetical protein [Palleronia pontilimi]MBJ3762791.1 hypothetical protein [Palleronia pontilimi]
MSYYEYRVVPAPKEAPRTKGVKDTAARFALGLEEALNAEGRDAWEYQRSETLVVSASQGFLRKTVTETVTVLIYRRWVDTVEAAPAQDGAAQWQTQLNAQRDAPQAHDAPIAASDAPAPEPRKTGSLSAKRAPDGALRPVPGAARD